jgi:ABC-type phosphate transport system substrate-binding protein
MMRGLAAVALVCLGQGANAESTEAAEQRVAMTAAEFVVIVNASNPLREISRAQVAAYFLKRRARWPDGNGVDPVDLPPDARARSAFSRDVLRRDPSDVSAFWVQEIFAGRAEPPEIRNSDAAVVAFISATPGAIGYVSANPNTPTVRVLVVTP